MTTIPNYSYAGAQEPSDCQNEGESDAYPIHGLSLKDVLHGVSVIEKIQGKPMTIEDLGECLKSAPGGERMFK